MINAFSLSSSNAAMPMNMQICTDKLGISPKVCNFSIPLGATINMDGVSAYLAVATLFLAKMYGISIPQSAMVSIILSIVMLSLDIENIRKDKRIFTKKIWLFRCLCGHFFV